MILKTSKISLGIRIQSLIQKSADHISLDVKRSCGDIHHAIQTLIKFLRCSGKICNTWHIDSYNTYRTCTLTGTEETAALFAELTEIQAEGGKRMEAADYLRGHPLKTNG